MSEHILVGTDGSKVALSAAEWAALEAEDRGVGVTVVGVYDANAFHRRLVRPKDLAEREAERAVTTTIARMAEVAPVVDAVGEVVEGPSPARELILRSESATLVVIGSYGTGLLHGTRLGTVADQVAAHSRVPVVVVPHVPTETDARDVVVGVDGSPGAEVSVEAALEVHRGERRSCPRPLGLVRSGGDGADRLPGGGAAAKVAAGGSGQGAEAGTEAAPERRHRPRGRP